jgi:Zn-dependent protease
MLRFSLFRIPVIVDWWFWLSCILLGGGITAQRQEDWIDVAVWSLVVFISIIIHELGHAFAGRRFGANPAIRLHGLGGTTYLPGAEFSRGQSIFVSAAGPMAGLALGGIVFGVNRFVADDPWLLRIALHYAIFINIYWTLINLLPIQPLDGGQILREALGPRRIQITSWIGFVVAAGLGVWALTNNQFILAIMAAMLAYHNFRRDPVEGGVVKG